MALSETIYRLRTEHGLSQGDLASELDVSRQSISKWETGSSVPELDKLVAMSRLFGVSLDELVLGEAQSDGAESVKAPEPETRPVERGRSLTQTIVGAVLLAVGALAFLLVTLLGGVLTGLVLALPFLLCGVICLAVRRGAGLWCAWLLFVGFEKLYLLCHRLLQPLRCAEGDTARAGRVVALHAAGHMGCHLCRSAGRDGAVLCRAADPVAEAGGAVGSGGGAGLCRDVFVGAPGRAASFCAARFPVRPLCHVHCARHGGAQVSAGEKA